MLRSKTWKEVWKMMQVEMPPCKPSGSGVSKTNHRTLEARQHDTPDNTLRLRICRDIGA